MVRTVVLAVMISAGGVAVSFASTLERAVGEIEQAFLSDDTDRLSALMPHKRLIAVHRELVKEDLPRKINGHHILYTDGTEAVVLLGGEIAPPSMDKGPIADSTPHSLFAYAGAHRFRFKDGSWTYEKKLPLNAGNELIAHDLNAKLSPGIGIHVTDRLKANVRSTHGLVLALNAAANIEHIRHGSRDLEFRQLGPLVWIDSGRGAKPFEIEYDLPVKTNEDSSNSAFFGNDSGHLRGQYGWTPSFYYDDPEGLASFRVRLVAPASHRAATDLPQTEREENGERIIGASSSADSTAFNLVYDTSWVQETVRGTLTLSIFASPDFEPEKEMIRAEFNRVVGFLKERFGAPPVTYFGVIQARNRGKAGWASFENQAIIAAEKGGRFLRGGDKPRVWFGHEVAHAWTAPSGPGANFLREGWAKYAEYLILEERFDAKTAQRLLDNAASSYFKSGADAGPSLLGDVANSGVSYSKGLWVFAMLEDRFGRDTLFTALRAFVAGEEGPHSIGTFRKALVRHIGPEADRFVVPWLEEAAVPSLRIEPGEGGYILVQDGGRLFPLDVTVSILNESGSEVWRGRVMSRNRRTAFSTRFTSSEYKVVIDPERRLLLNRGSD